MANYFDTFNWDTWLNDAYNYGNPYNLQQAPPPPLDFEATMTATKNYSTLSINHYNS